MKEQLKLTDEQERKIQGLRADFEKKQIATRAQIQALRVDLRQLFAAEAPDRAKIEGTMGGIEKLNGELRVARVGHWFDIYALLTADQRKIWKERRPGMGMEMGGRHMSGQRGRDGEDGPPMHRRFRR